MNNISKVYLRNNISQQNQPQNKTSTGLEADPSGLIHSFVSNPPRGRISPSDIFILWRISRHGSASSSDAAQAVINAYGVSMKQSNSEWLAALLELFNEMAISQPTPSHSNLQPSDKGQ